MSLAGAFASAWLLGWLLVRCGWPVHLREGSFVLRAALAHGLGTAATATAWGAHLLLAGSARWPVVVAVELVACVVLAVVVWWGRHRAGGVPLSSSRSPERGRRLAIAVFAVVATAAAVSFTLATAANPQGVADALDIWNLRAQLLWDSGSAWRRALAPSLHHGDYPLLLPFAIARGWQFVGHAEPVVPACIAASFLVATVAVVFGALRLLRNVTAAASGAAVLCACPVFVAVGAMQYADVPLAFFCVAALAVLLLHRELSPGGRGLPVLAGACVAAAAWTKNEGALFAVVVAIIVAANAVGRRGRAAWRELLAFALGGAPVFVALAVFKLWLAPTNDLVAVVVAGDVLTRLVDGSRWAAVLQGLLAAIWSLGPTVLLALVVWALVCRRQRAWLPLAVAGVMLGGYVLVYVATSVNLAWHLGTSCNRLLLHVLPLVVLGVFAGRPAR